MPGIQVVVLVSRMLDRRHKYVAGVARPPLRGNPSDCVVGSSNQVGRRVVLVELAQREATERAPVPRRLMMQLACLHVAIFPRPQRLRPVWKAPKCPICANFPKNKSSRTHTEMTDCPRREWVLMDTDVLVAGAGPIGLSTAIELRRRGISCRIVDPLDEPRQYAKAVGIQPRTLELFENMGGAPPGTRRLDIDARSDHVHERRRGRPRRPHPPRGRSLLVSLSASVLDGAHPHRAPHRVGNNRRTRSRPHCIRTVRRRRHLHPQRRQHCDSPVPGGFRRRAQRGPQRAGPELRGRRVCRELHARRRRSRLVDPQRLLRPRQPHRRRRNHRRPTRLHPTSRTQAVPHVDARSGRVDAGRIVEQSRCTTRFFNRQDTGTPSHPGCARQTVPRTDNPPRCCDGPRSSASATASSTLTAADGFLSPATPRTSIPRLARRA